VADPGLHVFLKEVGTRGERRAPDSLPLRPPPLYLKDKFGAALCYRPDSWAYRAGGVASNFGAASETLGRLWSLSEPRMLRSNISFARQQRHRQLVGQSTT